MKKYTVLKTVWFGGRRYEAGDEIELADRAADNLVRAGKVALANQPKPKAKKAQPEGGDQ
jgi:hypothetical protein